MVHARIDNWNNESDDLGVGLHAWWWDKICEPSRNVKTYSNSLLICVCQMPSVRPHIAEITYKMYSWFMLGLQNIRVNCIHKSTHIPEKKNKSQTRLYSCISVYHADPRPVGVTQPHEGNEDKLLLTQFLCQAICTKRTPKGTQVIEHRIYIRHCQKFKRAAMVQKMGGPNRAKPESRARSYLVAHTYRSLSYMIIKVAMLQGVLVWLNVHSELVLPKLLGVWSLNEF